MKWYRIVASLVCADSNGVNAACGYRFNLPLDGNMQLLEKDWQQSSRPYKVTRFWIDEPDLEGELVLHMRNSWLIKYDRSVKPDATVQLGEEVMSSGELLSIRDHADATHEFKITSIDEVRWFPTAETGG